jgi:hypothetical protein
MGGPMDYVQVILRVKVKWKLHYDRRSVGQFVLVSGSHLGPVTNSFISNYFLTAAQLLMSGALSDQRSGLLFTVAVLSRVWVQRYSLPYIYCLHFGLLGWTELSRLFLLIISRHGPHRKYHLTLFLLFRAWMLRSLRSNGQCLECHYLARAVV